MATYISAAEGASYLSQGGWPDSELITATAVMGAESSFQQDADNGIAAGLMQVNYRAHTQYDKDQLKSDPVYNCTCAYEIFQTQAPQNQWSHNKWETYPMMYKAYIPTARSGVATFHKEGGAGVAQHDLSKSDNPKVYPKEDAFDKADDALTGTIDAVSSVPEFLGKLGDSIFSRDFWWRVFKILIGAGMAGVAIHIILKSTGIENSIVSAVTKV